MINFKIKMIFYLICKNHQEWQSTYCRILPPRYLYLKQFYTVIALTVYFKINIFLNAVIDLHRNKT